MLDRTEPTLFDGTPISRLVMDATQEVSMRVIADAEIYKLELERIFTKTWICLGHDSELPQAGDYVVRNMGADQVIVARRLHGDIRSKAQLGLDKARVSLYGGLIFATWNHEGPSLEDHLGDMKWYFDVL